MQGLSVSRYTYTLKLPSGQMGQILMISQTSPQARTCVVSLENASYLSNASSHSVLWTDWTDRTDYPNMFGNWSNGPSWELTSLSVGRWLAWIEPCFQADSLLALLSCTLACDLTYVPLCDIVNYGLRAIGRTHGLERV